ncbi:MAG: hypothetical protein HND48_17065 [Chloroflexi bacterium]|nr:hypothetical protein [Chloroflexota bacterium]
MTARIQQLIRDSGISKRPAYGLSQRDVVAIAYGDHVRKEGEPPLVTLREPLKATYGEQINTVHVLPFYPYTSDDGFSVVDYWAVDPKLGTWDDVRALRAQFRMMFDAVFNHVSVSSAWFQAFLRGEAPYTDYFITVDPSTDLSLVRRPRTHPLLTPFETARGIQHVWTTFSADQVDVNAANPDLMLDLLRALLFYVAQGADLIRLDAIAYLWKEIGTTCIHLPQTHQVVQPHARRARYGRAGRADRDRDERAARREHLILRRWHERSADGLQFQPAAAAAAHVPHGGHDPPNGMGRDA